MSDIRWEGYSHEEIYAAVHQGPGQSISAGAEAAWAATEALILRIDERIAVAMAQSVGGWEGSAAEAGRTAMTPLGQWALDAANDAKITAQAVARQGEQARDLRNAMPEPNSAQLDAEYDAAFTDPTYLFHGRDDLQAAEQESANRAARAVDLMNGYTNNSYENRRHMDYWTLPPQVTVETTAPAAAPPGGPVAAGAGGFGEGSASPGGAAGVAAAGAPPGVAGAGTSVPAPGPVAPPGPGAAAAGGGEVPGRHRSCSGLARPGSAPGCGRVVHRREPAVAGPGQAVRRGQRRRARPSRAGQASEPAARATGCRAHGRGWAASAPSSPGLRPAGEPCRAGGTWSPSSRAATERRPVRGRAPTRSVACRPRAGAGPRENPGRPAGNGPQPPSPRPAALRPASRPPHNQASTRR
ncbi:hypothetical protein ACQPWY_11095 [Pseudonocardia xinjiangensis]|uniref:hypothetical protein n=1 Tax=Pseudonocardia xinjiangensis TaxID=75289 RepID=UPI003D8A57AC